MDNSVPPRNHRADVGALERRADWLRLETIRLVEIAKSGRYSGVFSWAEMFAALYYSTLRLKPTEPRWDDRDGFLLGKGHAAIGQHPVLANKELDLCFSMNYSPAEFRTTLEDIAEGRIDAAKALTGMVGPEEVAGAFWALNGPERHAKIVVSFA